MASFSDTTNKNGLIQWCERDLFGESPYAQISGNAPRLATFTGLINEAYARYAILALMSDNRWQWDDTNNTDLPIGTTNLVSGQADYSFGTDQVIIEQVEVQDSAGFWHGLSEIDEGLFSQNNFSLSQYLANYGSGGIPWEYQKVANSVFLNPKPNYNLTGGLKIRFKRGPSYFSTTVASPDTTKAPGFTSMHHSYLTDYAVWKYSLSRGLPQASTFGQLVAQWENEKIPEFYDKRSHEHSPRLLSAFRSSR